MAYTQSDDNQQRSPMIDVSAMNLKCAECGADITQLPFQPDPSRSVYCRDCNRKRRNNFRDRF